MHDTLDLFSSHTPSRERIHIAEGAWLLKGFALEEAQMLLDQVATLTAQSPFRHQVTPGGYTMSAAMTNCGEFGWVTDRQGYRYSEIDPETGMGWPDMPIAMSSLARRAAETAGYQSFAPQGCLINRYETGARMALHQDRDEKDLDAPIVSVSLGAPISFLFGGASRSDKTQRFRLEHGDVVVWGGPSRLFYHGVTPLGKRAEHPLTGAVRYNLTFRKVR